MKNTPSKLAASIPPITVVPMIWRATEPAPVAVHNGTVPKINANDVIKNRPESQPRALQRSIDQRLPVFVFVLG